MSAKHNILQLYEDLKQQNDDFVKAPLDTPWSE